MKIRSVGDELFHADERTDGRTDTTKLVVAFRICEKRLKIGTRGQNSYLLQQRVRKKEIGQQQTGDPEKFRNKQNDISSLFSRYVGQTSGKNYLSLDYLRFCNNQCPQDSHNILSLLPKCRQNEIYFFCSLVEVNHA
jgi:hypothetical protein